MASSGQTPRTYQNTRKLLSEMESVRSDSDRLAMLFKIGDRRIADLIKALDSPDPDVSVRAQTVIRYLPNIEGMKALHEWYGKQRGGFKVAGPIPLPLNDWDYEVINANFVGRPSRLWGGRGVEYIYALALDDSKRSETLLDELIRSAGPIDEADVVGYAIRRVQQGQPRKALSDDPNLAKLVLDNAFFVSPLDRKCTSSRLLALNGGNDKALVEVHINRGSLAEEWYHVIISKRGQEWRFSAIVPVAVS